MIINRDMEKKDEFYEKLEKKLKEDTKFPSKYLFKFIVPTGNDKIKEVEELFNHLGAIITKNQSKTGKFTSISIFAIMDSAGAVIEKYREAEKIEGIISL